MEVRAAILRARLAKLQQQVDQVEDVDDAVGTITRYTKYRTAAWLAPQMKRSQDFESWLLR